jgi:hypothetical protein
MVYQYSIVIRQSNVIPVLHLTAHGTLGMTIVDSEKSFSRVTGQMARNPHSNYVAVLKGGGAAVLQLSFLLATTVLYSSAASAQAVNIVKYGANGKDGKAKIIFFGGSDATDGGNADGVSITNNDTTGSATTKSTAVTVGSVGGRGGRGVVGFSSP